MPSNAEFSFSVLVGGYAIPEYRKDQEVFVETNLYSPVSYKEKEEEVVDGQTEVNEWPVTPYTIEITTQPHAPLARYTISVDGFVVTKVVLTGGQSRVVKGFHDNERGGLASFVFSLPRYAMNKSDRRKQDLRNVGTIRVTSNDTWKNWLHTHKLITRGRKGTAFVPATKGDTLAVTSGQYTMVTTRMGQNIPVPGSCTSFVRRWKWATGVRRGVLEVKCRTEDAVRAMGFEIQPYPVIVSMNNNVSAGTSRELKQSSTGGLEIQLGPVNNNNNNKIGGVPTASISKEVKDSSVDGQEIRSNHSDESTVVNPAQEWEMFNNTNVGPSNNQVEMNLLYGGSRKVQLPEDSTGDDQVKPLETSVEETVMTDMEVTASCRNAEPSAMETAACSTSREVKAEDMVQTVKDPERKPKDGLLQHELIDLTADDKPEVIDLTTDDYLPDVYEVKFTTKIEVVHLEEVENSDTALPMQT